MAFRKYYTFYMLYIADMNFNLSVSTVKRKFSDMYTLPERIKIHSGKMIYISKFSFIFQRTDFGHDQNDVTCHKILHQKAMQYSFKHVMHI